MKKSLNLLVFTFLSLTLIPCSLSQAVDRAYIFVHGLFSNPREPQPMIDLFYEQDPDAYYMTIDLEGKTLKKIETQTDLMHQQVAADENIDASTDVSIIAHSQGGIVGLYFILLYGQEFNVKRFCCFGSPQAGMFGLPGFFDEYVDQQLSCNTCQLSLIKKWGLKALCSFLNAFVATADSWIYSRVMQSFGPFNYWRDPEAEEDGSYFEHNHFMPYFLNQIDHPLFDQFKENLSNLDLFVAVGTTGEDIVDPQESTVLSFFEPGSSQTMLSFDEYYDKEADPRGLWAVQQKEGLHLDIIDNDEAHHTALWNGNTVFDHIKYYFFSGGLPAVILADNEPPGISI